MGESPYMGVSDAQGCLPVHPAAQKIADYHSIGYRQSLGGASWPTRAAGGTAAAGLRAVALIRALGNNPEGHQSGVNPVERFILEGVRDGSP